MLRSIKRRRRGVSTVQWALLAAVITIVVIATVKSLGSSASERLDNTSGAVGDPSQLKNYMH
ncbi:MAG: hypothetical protein KDA41_21595 [Planctomycetales bacterium]|nr:hypothetical protein [Planctomycetales bacterium]